LSERVFALNTSKARVLIYVQHLLGIGHLKRAATLARAFAAEGMQVTLASGGLAVPGISFDGVRLLQLPAVGAADLSFKVLLDETGREIDEAWKRRRSDALLAAWRDVAPQVLVLELFPFGRRQMRFELLPLLDAAAAAPHRPAIVCSVRDILGGLKSPERRQEALDLVERYFDRVLVHGDPAVVSFERTFPGVERIAGRLAYTGYVVDSALDSGGNAGRDEILVSAGGGAVGAGLLEAAILAKPLTALRNATWRMLAGNNLPEADFQHLAELAGRDSGIRLERSRTDFTTLLANCRLSVSQAGYNTLMETVRAGARAVVVPFATGRETEQALRARCFAERGLLEVVEEGALTPQALAAAIDRAAHKPRPAPGAIDLDGARKSAALIAGLARDRLS
jgi:predicted glycosyltransferase